MLANLRTLCSFLLYVPVSVLAAENNAQLENRVQQLEEELLITQEQVTDSEHRLSDMMNISGYADIEYRINSKDNSHDSFRIHHFSLFFERELGDNWRFFSEIEYEDAPKFDFRGGDTFADATTEGKIFLEAVNISYVRHPMLNVRFGRFFTPAGIWSVDHYPPFVGTQERPLHIRKIFPQIIDGAMFYGTVSMGNMFLNYDLYTGNGEGSTGNKDENDDKAFGAKASLLLPFFQHTEIGASVYSDSKDTSLSEEERNAIGAHTKIRLGAFTLQSEYASYDTDTFGRSGFYAQGAYDFRRWTFGYRYDYYDSDDTDNSEVDVNTMFLNYHFNSSTVAKLEHHMYTDSAEGTEDYSQTIASIVVYLAK